MNNIFSKAVKQVQSERGSRRAYEGREFESEVTDDLRAFLARIDTAFLSTASKDGQPYIQHRGGPRGFIKALDDATIGFVDLAGNKQYISTGNLRENNRVCLMLIDYSTRRRVKVWGTARVVPATLDLLTKLGFQGQGRPEQVMLISVDAWDVNCPQHIPQKVDAHEVADVITALRQRIADLEEQGRCCRDETK